MENRKKEIGKELYELFYNLHDGKKYVYVTNKMKRSLLKATIAVDAVDICLRFKNPNATGEYGESDCESITLEELSDFISIVTGYRESLTHVKNIMIFNIGELVDEFDDGRVDTIFYDMKENLNFFITSLDKKIREFHSILNASMVKILIKKESDRCSLESTTRFAKHIIKELDNMHERLNKDCFELAALCE